MHAFEYLVGLVSILVGIALADIALSLHRLLRAKGRVRWHWQSLASTLLVVVVVLDLWWSLRQLENAGITITVALFLPLLCALFVFFLLAAAALPDEVPEAGVDLREYYEGNRRYFWTLFALYVLLSSVHVITMFSAVHGWQFAIQQRLPANLMPNLFTIGLMASLVFIRRSWWHAVVIIFLLGALLNSHLMRPLT
jgi:hypothetical protein